MKLSQVRPCDNCGGKIAPTFYVVRYSIALFKKSAVNTTLGMHQMLGGGCWALAIAETMSPEPDAVRIVMDGGDDDSKQLTHELFICNDCHVQPICLAEIVARIGWKEKVDV